MNAYVDTNHIGQLVQFDAYTSPSPAAGPDLSPG